MSDSNLEIFPIAQENTYLGIFQGNLKILPIAQNTYLGIFKGNLEIIPIAQENTCLVVF